MVLLKCMCMANGALGTSTLKRPQLSKSNDSRHNWGDIRDHNSDTAHPLYFFCPIKRGLTQPQTFIAFYSSSYSKQDGQLKDISLSLRSITTCSLVCLLNREKLKSYNYMHVSCLVGLSGDAESPSQLRRPLRFALVINIVVQLFRPPVPKVVSREGPAFIIHYA